MNESSLTIFFPRPRDYIVFTNAALSFCDLFVLPQNGRISKHYVKSLGQGSSNIIIIDLNIDRFSIDIDKIVAFS